MAARKISAKRIPKMPEARYLLYLINDALIMIDLVEDYLCLPDRVAEETDGFFPTAFSLCGEYKLHLIKVHAGLSQYVREVRSYVVEECAHFLPSVEIMVELHRKSGFLAPKRAHRFCAEDIGSAPKVEQKK